jgi:purine-binding chemotaxis protein CheW
MEGILMRAPDILARDEFLSFNLGAEQYAIDILRVREIRASAPVTRIANCARAMLGIFDLRGAIVPVFDMRLMLGLPAAPAGGSPVVIILDIEGRPAGIVVDAVCQVIGLESDAVKPLPRGTTQVDDACIRGAASIGDEMLIVLDIARLMRTAGAAAQAQAA